jgi:hypothetical protein
MSPIAVINVHRAKNVLPAGNKLLLLASCYFVVCNLLDATNPSVEVVHSSRLCHAVKFVVQLGSGCTQSRPHSGWASALATFTSQ